MRKLYEEVVETKLGHRASLRNKMREYQKKVKKSTNLYEKERLGEKIQQIARSLNGSKKKDKCLRQYAHQVDLRINEAVCLFIEEAKKSQAVCVYEDLDITEFDRGRKNNKRDSMWVRGQLTKKIQSKLNWLGIPHVAVIRPTPQRCVLNASISMITTERLSLLFVPCANMKMTQTIMQLSILGSVLLMMK